MQHFSNYFVQILVIRPKFQRGQIWSRGGAQKNSSRGSCPGHRLLLTPIPMQN